MFLPRSKKRRFKLATERARDNRYLVDQCDRGSWYVSLSQTFEEFREGGWGTLRLYNKRGCICKAKVVYWDKKKVVSLGDIVTERWYRGRGYGSIVLENVIKISCRLGAKSIEGQLSEADINNFDVLRHFYKEKYGFEVDMRHGGKISRKLDDCQKFTNGQSGDASAYN